MGRVRAVPWSHSTDPWMGPLGFVLLPLRKRGATVGQAVQQHPPKPAVLWVIKPLNFWSFVPWLSDVGWEWGQSSKLPLVLRINQNQAVLWPKRHTGLVSALQRVQGPELSAGGDYRHNILREPYWLGSTSRVCIRPAHALAVLQVSWPAWSSPCQPGAAPGRTGLVGQEAPASAWHA